MTRRAFLLATLKRGTIANTVTEVFLTVTKLKDILYVLNRAGAIKNLEGCVRIFIYSYFARLIYLKSTPLTADFK